MTLEQAYVLSQRVTSHFDSLVRRLRPERVSMLGLLQNSPCYPPATPVGDVVAQEAAMAAVLGPEHTLSRSVV